MNIAMADTALTTWSSKRFHSADSNTLTGWLGAANLADEPLEVACSWRQLGDCSLEGTIGIVPPSIGKALVAG